MSRDRREAGAATPEVLGEFLAMGEEVFHAALAGLSPRLEALRSPTETLAAGLFLQRAYGRVGDPWHANRHFGALMRERLAERLGVCERASRYAGGGGSVIAATALYCAMLVASYSVPGRNSWVNFQCDG